MCRNVQALIPGEVDIQAFPRTGFRGFPVPHADVMSANVMSFLPLPSNGPGAKKSLQMRMLLTIQSPIWFYRNNIFFSCLHWYVGCVNHHLLFQTNLFLWYSFFSAYRLLANWSWQHPECCSELYLYLIYLPKSAELCSEEHYYLGAFLIFMKCTCTDSVHLYDSFLLKTGVSNSFSGWLISWVMFG